MPTVFVLIQPFFAWKQNPPRRFAASSRLKYEPLLEDFARWAGDREISEMSTALLEFEYLPAWTAAFTARNSRPPAQNTLRLVHNVLSSFFDYAWRRGLIGLNPMLAIPRPSYEVPLNDWLNPEEDELIARVRKTPLEEIVYGLGRLAGLRCSEITGLQFQDVHLDEQLLDVYGSKSAASVRSVIVFPELAEMIDRWIDLQAGRGLTGRNAYLVTTAAGDPVAKPYLWRIIKRVAARAGVRLHGQDANGRPLALDRSGENVSRVSPHTLRRTHGSDLLNRGVRIEVVSAQLGHASVKVTETAYAKLLTTTKRNELLRIGTGFPFLDRGKSRGLGYRGFGKTKTFASVRENGNGGRQAGPRSMGEVPAVTATYSVRAVLPDPARLPPLPAEERLPAGTEQLEEVEADRPSRRVATRRGLRRRAMV